MSVSLHNNSLLKTNKKESELSSQHDLNVHFLFYPFFASTYLKLTGKSVYPHCEIGIHGNYNTNFSLNSFGLLHRDVFVSGCSGVICLCKMDVVLYTGKLLVDYLKGFLFRSMPVF